VHAASGGRPQSSPITGLRIAHQSSPSKETLYHQETAVRNYRVHYAAGQKALYPGDPAGLPANTIPCRCVVITRVVPESQRADADAATPAEAVPGLPIGGAPGRFTTADVIGERLHAGFRSEADFTNFLTELWVKKTRWAAR